jgi:hypothetical protein
MNLRETTVREIFKTQKSGDKLEAKKRRQKQQRTNKNRKKTHRKLKETCSTCRLDVEDEFHFSVICP